jgi:hypothetical protein
MKKIILLITVIAITSSNLFSQKVIAVETNSVTSLHSSIADALNQASNGSTIYLPGGAFDIGSLIIDKGVKIIGAGHYADSSVATGITLLNGNISFVTGADQASLQGVYVTGFIRLGTNADNQTLNSISIKRCNIENLNLSFNGSSTTASSFISISENVIRGSFSGGYAQNVSVNNNFFNGTIHYFNGNVLFSNNLFLNEGYWGHLLNYVVSATFESNIFISQNILGTGSNSNVFTKNVFTTNNQMGSGNVESGNKFNVQASSIFVNQSGNAFNYSHDYHLANSSPAIGAGVNDTDAGIYGGANPYKEGAVPHNPHITQKTISNNTDANGNINVDIKVSAQTR